MLSYSRKQKRGDTIPTNTLRSPFSLDGRTIPNRVVFQPMEGCDCTEDGAPGELTIAKYHRAAQSGAGIIWFEANAVCPEGRTIRGR